MKIASHTQWIYMTDFWNEIIKFKIHCNRYINFKWMMYEMDILYSTFFDWRKHEWVHIVSIPFILINCNET